MQLKLSIFNMDLLTLVNQEITGKILLSIGIPQKMLLKSLTVESVLLLIFPHEWMSVCQV